MAKQKPDKFGYIIGKMYSHKGAQYQYQGPLRDGRLQFSRFSDSEPIKMTVKIAKEYFG